MHRSLSTAHSKARLGSVLGLAMLQASMALAQASPGPASADATKEEGYPPVTVIAPALPYRQFDKIEITGSAILLNLIAIAIVLRVDFENRVVQHGGRL